MNLNKHFSKEMHGGLWSVVGGPPSGIQLANEESDDCNLKKGIVVVG
jgi:hypothetical protein